MIDGLKRLFNKSYAYKACFKDDRGNLTAHGQLVIKDLIRFCNVHNSTVHINNGVIDPVRMALEEGRRTVFNRLRDMLDISEADILKAKELQDNG